MLASAGMALPSPHRGPGSVRIATRIAAGDLRLAVDINGVSVRSALQPVGLIGRTRNHRSITTGIRILPRHGDARLSAFERRQPRRRACPYSLSVLGRSREYQRKPPSIAWRARQRSGERKTCLKPPDDLTP